MQYSIPPEQNLNNTRDQDGQTILKQEIISIGLDLIEKLVSVYISQKPDWIEALGGCCENRNIYYIFPSDETGTIPNIKKSIPVFESQEESNCCLRKILPGSYRPFNLTIQQPNQQQNPQVYFKTIREYKCTICCFKRPFMEVTSENGEKIGTLNFPFMCCDRGVDIMDSIGQLIYSIKGSCCQCPFFCVVPCIRCQKAKLDVIDNQGQKVSEILKEPAGFCIPLLGVDASNFRVIFPKQSTGHQKILLLAAALFIDFNYWERSPVDRICRKFII